MGCDKCFDKQYLPWKDEEDTWIPCSCLMKSRLERLAVRPEYVDEIIEYPDADHLIISSDIAKAVPVMNNLIWLKLKQDIDIDVVYVYSGDLTCALMENSVETLHEHENPDVLFVYLVVSESTPKLVGRMVNRIYEVRKNEGLRTHFVTPYGGTRLFARYEGEDAVLTNHLRNLPEIIVK